MDLAFGSDNALPLPSVGSLPLIPLGIGAAIVLLSNNKILTAGMLYVFYRSMKGE